jgi:hypothetical protein
MAGPTPPIIYSADELACFANGCSDWGRWGLSLCAVYRNVEGTGSDLFCPKQKKVKNN